MKLKWNWDKIILITPKQRKWNNYSTVNATHKSVKYALWFAPGSPWCSASASYLCYSNKSLSHLCSFPPLLLELQIPISLPLFSPFFFPSHMATKAAHPCPIFLSLPVPSSHPKKAHSWGGKRKRKVYPRGFTPMLLLDLKCQKNNEDLVS